jgi:hypothetical protein
MLRSRKFSLSFTNLVREKPSPHVYTKNKTIVSNDVVIIKEAVSYVYKVCLCCAETLKVCLDAFFEMRNQSQAVAEHPILKYSTIALVAAMLLGVVAFQLISVPAAQECLFEKSAESGGAISMSLVGCFNPSTWWPLLVIMQVGMLLMLREAFYKGVSSLFVNVLGSHKKTVLLVVVVVAALTSFYLARGDVLLGDAYLFQPTAELFRNVFVQDFIPHHSFMWYGGSAHFEYYGQMYFGMVSDMSFVLGDVNLALKVVNWLLHIGAAVVMYFFAFELIKSRRGAFIAAIAFSVSYEHIARIMIHGRLMNSLLYLLLPLMLLLTEKYLRGKISPVTAAVTLGLTAASIFLTNPGDGLFLLVASGVYFALRMVQQIRLKKIKFDSLVKVFVIGGVAFFVLTSFWTIPFVIEKADFNAGARAGELTGITFRPDTLSDIVSFPGQRGISLVYYLGIAQIVFSALAVLYLIREKKKYALTALTAFGGFALLFMLFQSPRYVPAFVLSLSVLTAFGIERFVDRIRMIKKFKFITAEQLVIFMLLIVVVDSAAGLVQPSYPDFSEEKQAIAEGIPEDAVGRSLDLHSDRRSFYSSLTYLATGKESVMGSILEGAPKSANYGVAIAAKAAEEYYDGGQEFSDETLNGLYLFNVQHVVLHPEQIGSSGRNIRAALGLENEIEVIELEGSPVIASGRIEHFSNDELEREENYFLRPKFETREVNYGVIDAITERMSLDRVQSTANVILVKESVERTVSDGEISVKAVADVRHSKVTLEVEQSADAFLQLSYAASPEISVFVDGNEVYYYITAINTIAVETTAGNHTIDIVAKPSKLRKTLFFLAVSGLLVLMGLLIIKFLRRLNIAKTRNGRQ